MKLLVWQSIMRKLLSLHPRPGNTEFDFEPRVLLEALPGFSPPRFTHKFSYCGVTFRYPCLSSDLALLPLDVSNVASSCVIANTRSFILLFSFIYRVNLLPALALFFHLERAHTALLLLLHHRQALVHHFP